VDEASTVLEMEESKIILRCLVGADRRLDLPLNKLVKFQEEWD
jgi:hypothetical protein